MRYSRCGSWLAFAALGTLGCVQGKVLTDPANNISSDSTKTASLIVISPSTISGQAGQSVQLQATVFDQAGDTLKGQSVTWTSTNNGVMTISSTGAASLVTAGTANATAASDGLAVSVPATITPGSPAPVASVSVSPSDLALTPGSTGQLSATTQDSSGNVLKNRPVTWVSSDTTVATVSTNGIVTAIAVGTAILTASREGHNGKSHVSVSAPTTATVASVTISPTTSTLIVGQSTTLAAVLKDSASNVLSGRTVTWTSSNTGVATVSSLGVVSAVAAGTTVISASSGGQQGTATVSVNPVPVASLSVSPPNISLTVGGTSLVSATPLDANGNPLTGRPITWSSSNASVATVSSTGVVTAAAQGSATITATCQGKTGSVAVTVSPVSVGSVSVSPSSASVVVGATTSLGATVKDASGNVLTGYAISWSSSNSGVATVSSSGVVTGVAVGSATITASAGGKSGTASVTVTSVPAASVTVSPSSASIQVYATTPLTATVKDASGGVLTGYTVTWSSSNTGIATVSSSGVVTGAGVGSATITASAGGKSGGASVSVTAAPVASVSVSPGSASMLSGQGVQLTATAKDAHGNTVTGQTFTWSSSSTGVATVGSLGYVTGVASGTATISASTAGQSGSSGVTVTSSSGGQLAGCAAPDLVSWNFASQNWGPLDYHNFLDGGQVVVDPTTATGYSAMWTWAVNNNADDGGQINATFPSRQSAYVRFAYKQDPVFPDGGIKKILRFRQSGYNALLGTLDIDGDKYIWFFDGLDPNTVYYQSSGPSPSANRGSWHWFEVYNDISQSGNLQFKVWLDGNLIISGTNSSSNQGLSFGIASPGGTFNQPAGVGTDWITDIGVGSNCVSPPW